MISSQQAAQDLARDGILRVAINTGNPVLAFKAENGGDPSGPSVEIARELARQLELPLQFIVYDTAGHVVAAADKNIWDLGFLAIDPLRAKTICFSPPYVGIEGTYMVREASTIRHCAEMDAPGNRIAVENNAAYDLYLRKVLRHASLVRGETPGASVGLFLDTPLEALGGVRQGLEQIAKEHAGMRVLEDRFMAIEQAICVPIAKGIAAAYLASQVAELKASGFIRQALDQHGQYDAQVAP